MKLETLFNSLGNLTATGRITPFTTMKRHVKHPANLFIMVIMVMVQMFFACTQSDDPAARPGSELQVSVTAAGYASVTPETRATDAEYATTFAAGDQIGVIAVQNNAVVQDNISYTYSSGAWAPTDAGKKAYVPFGTVDWIVYYPYSTDMDGKKTEAEIFAAFAVPVDQGSQLKYTLSDLMIWSGGMSAGNTLAATLTHRLAMVEVRLSAGTGNASVQAGTSGVILPWNISGTTWRCLVKPAAGATVSGRHIAYSTAITWQQAGVTLEAGKYTSLDVANSASTIEGYAGEIEVRYKGGETVTIPASDIRWLESGSTVASMTLKDYPGKEYLIGRVVDPGNLIKLKFDGSGELLFRDADAEGFIPVGSYAEFQMIRTNGSPKNYRQEADIDLMDEEWNPIENSGGGFYGEYDGAGKKISNLKISVNGTYRGLFSRNLGTIRNVHIVSGTITSTGSNSGGICGINESAGQIISCSNAATVSGIRYVGGVSGDNSGTVTACYNTGTVKGTGGSFAGGVSGGNTNTVTACYNTGAVSGTQYVGGVSGDNYNGTGAVTACYNTGTVSGNNQVGGVVGYNYGGTVTACYNTGTVSRSSGTNTYFGSVTGYNTSTVTACYWKSGTNTKGVGSGTDTTTPFPDYFNPGTSAAWGTGDGSDTNRWWKAGINYTNTLPKLWFE